jgi:hypothetical protein
MPAVIMYASGGKANVGNDAWLPQKDGDDTTKPRKLKLSFMQSIVGGYIEIIHLKPESAAYMVVNDGGALLEDRRENKAATAFLGRQGVVVYGDAIVANKEHLDDDDDDEEEDGGDNDLEEGEIPAGEGIQPS